MPSHRVHTFFDRQYFGKAYWKIHRAMDFPVLYLGKKHRKYNHDIPSGVAIADYSYPRDPNARSAAFLHIWLDKYCSANPEFKKNLEFFAEMDAKRRKREKQTKRTNKKREEFLLSPEEEQLKKDLEKMLEIQRLAMLLSQTSPFR